MRFLGRRIDPSSSGLWRPPTLYRSGEEGWHTTWLEHFFDLVYVFALAQIAHFLHEHLTVGGFLGTLDESGMLVAIDKPAPHSLTYLRTQDLPPAGDEAFHKRLDAIKERRQRLLTVVACGGWSWKPLVDPLPEDDSSKAAETSKRH